jgi:predicted RecB family nuclease
VPLDPRFGIELPRDVLGAQSVSIIKGIGEQRAASLQRAGVSNLALLAEAQPEQLAQAGGVSVSTAQNWVSQAQALLRG